MFKCSDHFLTYREQTQGVKTGGELCDARKGAKLEKRCLKFGSPRH